MTSLVYYVIRQHGGWGVQYDGLVRSGHRTLAEAIEVARSTAPAARERGLEWLLRIQGDNGHWIEERSFCPPPPTSKSRVLEN